MDSQKNLLSVKFNILKKLETYNHNQPSNSNNSFSLMKKHHSSLSKIKTTRTMKTKVHSNSNQKNYMDINSLAFQTLSDAALNVKNLLSDFLVNADPDDKQTYHIEDELKKINKKKNPINIFTLTGEQNSDKENDEKIIFRKNTYVNHYNKLKFDNYDGDYFKKMKTRDKINNRIKNFSLDENDIDLNKVGLLIKHNLTNKSILENKKKAYHRNSMPIFYETFYTKKGDKRKNSNLSSNDVRIKKPKIKFLDIQNTEKKLKKKNTINNYSYNLLSSSSEEEELNEEKDENKIKMMELRNKLSFDKQNLSNKRYSYISNDKIIKKKKTNSNANTYKNTNTINNELDNKFNDYNRSNTIHNSNNKNKYKEDKTDIRNYINLSKKGFKKFNDLCENLRKTFILSKDQQLIDYINADDDYKEKNKEEMNLNILNKTILSLEHGKNYKNEKNEMNSSLNNNLEIVDINNDDDSEKINEMIKEFHFRRIINQNKLVYDSLSDEELYEETEGQFFIYPNGYFIFIFDMIMLFLSIYAIILPPFEFAFYVDKIPLIRSVIIEFVIDCFFIIDFILGFFTGYLNFDEQLISNNKSIFIHYLKTWFFLDLISGIPINSIFILIMRNKNTITLSFFDYKWKVYQLLRYIRLIKLFKTFRHNSFTNSINKMISGIDVLVKWFNLYMSLFIFISSVHLLSCIFIFLAQLEFPNWIYINGYDIDYQRFDIYITSFYYICATVFTIGYGDVVSISIYERFFNILLLIVGIMIYSYAVSAISNYVQNVDSKTLEYQHKVAILNQIKMTHERMPQSLFNKISKFLLYKLGTESKDKNEIMDNLPLTLRNKLIMEMYKNIIHNFIFFKYFDNTDFIIRVILAFKPILGVKNERLVNEGDYIEEIIFVKRGRLSLEIPLPLIIKKETINKIETLRKTKTSFQFGLNKTFIPISTTNKVPTLINSSTLEEINDDEKEFKNLDNKLRAQQQYIKIIEIRRNEHFGDILMFLNKRSPLSVKVKTKVCELFLLKKTDAVEISMSFPNIWRKIIKKSLFNMEQIERLINKTLKFFYIHNEGLNHKGNTKENYFRREPTMNNNLLNINPKSIFKNVSVDEEKYELQSIPSYDDEENEEEEDEVNFEEEGSNDLDLFKKKKVTKETNIKTVIKEVDENSDKSEESEKKNESNIDNNINNSTSENNNNDENNKEENDNEDTLSDKTKENLLTNSKDSESSRRTNKTLLVDIKNKLIDYLSDYYDDKSKRTLISSNSLTLPYTVDEINNESNPFEEPIDINKNEKLKSNLLPNSILLESNYQYNNVITNQKEKSLKKDNNILNDILILLNKINDISPNSKNLNSSFHNIQIQSNCSNLFIKCTKFSKTQSITNKYKNDKDNNYVISINKTNSSPIINSRKDNLKNNENVSYFNSKSFINKSITNFKEKPSIQKVQSINNIFSSKRRKTSLKFFRNNQINNTKTFSNSSLSSKKNNTNDMLNVISQNIEKNSLNLNNPQYFYQSYFSSLMNKEDKNNITSRLKNIAKIIENNIQKVSTHTSAKANSDEEENQDKMIN